jgi:hypothetical protein
MKHMKKPKKMKAKLGMEKPVGLMPADKAPKKKHSLRYGN